MSEDLFRIVVTIAVMIAAVAFVAQAAITLGLYRAVRRMQERSEPLMDRMEPVLSQLSPAIEKMQNLTERAGPAVDRLGPFFDKAGATIESAGKTMEAARQMIEENRPRIAEIASDGAAIARTGREQVERVGEIIQDAGERTRARIEQIDHSLDGAIEQVSNAGDAVKSAAKRPVREVSGVAAGVAAVISTLVRGRKYPVDHATLDEEMFI